MTTLFRIPDPALVARAKLYAAGFTYDGQATPAAQRRVARSRLFHPQTQTVIIYTRDAGMHSSGWWKNPDFERCFHLSLSFAAQEHGEIHPLPFDRPMAEKWARLFFGDDVNDVWVEPPFSDEGKRRGVHHYRLFCDEGWQPKRPRGEVYSKRYTPAEWKSWSDIHGADNGDGEFGRDMGKGEVSA